MEYSNNIDEKVDYEEISQIWNTDIYSSYITPSLPGPFGQGIYRNANYNSDPNADCNWS